jgi:serine/threonine-protein kinase
VTSKAEESAIIRPTIPAEVPAPSEPVSVGVACASCRKHNPASAEVCGSCGAVLVAGGEPARSTSAERERGEAPADPAAEGDADPSSDDEAAPRDVPRVSQPEPEPGRAAAASFVARLSVGAPDPPPSVPGEGPWAEGPELLHVSSRTRSLGDLGLSRRETLASYDALPAAPIADPLIGVVVAERYRIAELIGRGGMGIVYKVEHTYIGKLLAMKLLTGELSRNPEVVRRFKQEALTVSKLSSPNTVQVFDFGQSDGLTYLVMELVAGEDLGRVLRATGPMSFSRLGKICVQVCSSLAEAHAKGIVHRDIKPENIMLMKSEGGTDVAKVLDFGLAKLRESSELNEMTSHGAIVGTPYFMSPEQVRGEAVDARSDVYSLGAVMYRALTGHHPFNGPTPMAVFTKHLTEEPVPPMLRAPERGIPTGVNDVVLRALCKDPAERWQRVEDLQAALIGEVRSAGISSVDELLESDALRRLAKVVVHAASETSAVVGAPAALATRDEIEAYERKLRRQRYSALGFVGALAVVAAGASIELFANRPVEFTGLETEPNNRASEANALPLGRSVTGHVGKRLDATSSDVDFYAFDVPAAGADAGGGEVPGGARVVSLKVTALPNFATCTMLFRAGLSSALYQFCVGRPGRDLEIDALRLDPGRYLLAVKQDLDRYGATSPPFVHENVSDPYLVTVAPARSAPDFETEPNDQIASATPVATGAGVSAVFGWARDRDMFCAAPGSPAVVRWRARDVTRDAGSVLEVTPMHGAIEGAPVRIHPGGKGPITATDVLSPWSGSEEKDDGDSPRCLRARLVNDPWTSDRASGVPFGGSERYVVELEAVR